MIESKIFHNIAEKNFGVFSLCSESDIDYLREIYKDKNQLRSNIKEMILVTDNKIKSITKIELFCSLSEFLFNKCEETSNIEICAIYSIFWDTLRLSFKKKSKRDVFNFFKQGILRHSMDRPPYQIGILKKATVEKITEFFVDNIYMRFEFLVYMKTKKKDIELVNKDIFEVTLPHILGLNLASEVLPRNAKILKQYTENKKPKTELEQKIELILEFEREKLDKKIEDKFAVQETVFNKKVEDLLSRKKK